jgi:uncharacterized protein (TIRG00374 family)
LNPGHLFRQLLSSSDPVFARRKNGVFLGLAFLLAALLLFLALRGVDWAVFQNSFARISYVSLPAFILMLAVSYFLRAIRWKLLIGGLSPAALGEVFWARMTGYLGNLLLPARAGELVRSVYLSRRSEHTASFLLATCLAEGVVDVVVLVVLGSIALSGMNTASGALLYANRILMLAGSFGLAALILLPRIGNTVVRIIAGWRFLTDGQKEKLGGWIAQFMLGLRSLLGVRRIFLFLLLTWCTDAVIVVLLSAALRMQIPFPQAILLLAGLGLSSAIPSVPGYIGVYQFVAVAVLEPFGVPRESALTLILVDQALNVITVAILGGMGLWRIRGGRSAPQVISPPD